MPVKGAEVEQVLVRELSPGHLVIMDNLSSHKGPKVRELIEAAGARLLYLPPCSPDFNPIETGSRTVSPREAKLCPEKGEVVERDHAIEQGGSLTIGWPACVGDEQWWGNSSQAIHPFCV